MDVVVMVGNSLESGCEPLSLPVFVRRIGLQILARIVRPDVRNHVIRINLASERPMLPIYV